MALSEVEMLKEAKAAAFQLRSPPAGEAKAMNLKDLATPDLQYM